MVSMAARGLGPMLEAVGARLSFWSEEAEGEKSLFVGRGGIWGMLLSAVGFSEDSRPAEESCSDCGVSS